MKREGCKPGHILFQGKCVPIPKNNQECRELFAKGGRIINYQDLKRVNDAMHKEPKNFTRLKNKLLSIGGKEVADERELWHPLAGIKDRSHFFVGLVKNGKLYPKTGLRCSKLKIEIKEDDQGVRYKFPPKIDVPLEYRMDIEKEKYGSNCYVASGYVLDIDEVWKPHFWLMCDGKIVELSGKRRKKYYGHFVKGYYDIKDTIWNPDWDLLK